MLKNILIEALKHGNYKDDMRYLVTNYGSAGTSAYINILKDYKDVTTEYSDNFIKSTNEDNKLFYTILYDIIFGDSVLLRERKKEKKFLHFTFKDGSLYLFVKKESDFSEKEINEFKQCGNYFPAEDYESNAYKNIYKKFNDHIVNNLNNLLATFPEKYNG